MQKFASIVLPLLALPAVASAQFAESRRMWDGEMKKRCPGHHVDWVGDGENPAAIDAYDAILPPHLRREVLRIADYSHRCSNEKAGYSCEWAAHIDATWKLKLLPNFASWACDNIKCKELAFCKISFK